MPRHHVLSLVLVTAIVTTAWTPHARGDARLPPAGGLSTSIVNGADLAGAGARARRQRAVSTVTTGRANVAQKLAGKLGKHQLAGNFEQLLVAFGTIETRARIPAGDASGAVALFLIAAYEAYRGASIDSSHYEKVILQMHDVLATSPAFANATMAQRRELYEEMAILGMYMFALRAEIAKQSNGRAQRELQASAGTYLRNVLGVDASRVEIGPTGVVVQSPAGAGTRASTGATARSAAADAVAGIETVGFFSQIEYGVGGMIMNVPTPIVLFKSGDALLDMKHLADAGGIDASKRAHPRAWTKWRRAGGTIERLDGSKWRALEYRKFHPRLPSGTRLARRYQSMSGGGNIAAGTVIASWRNLSFDASGRFTSDSAGGMSGGRVAARSRTPTTGGTYDIAGYTLTLRYDDGRTITHSIIADTKDTKVIWIDGRGYTSR